MASAATSNGDGGSEVEQSFNFAYNNVVFSDCTLRIQIVRESKRKKLDSDYQDRTINGDRSNYHNQVKEEKSTGKQEQKGDNLKSANSLLKRLKERFCFVSLSRGSSHAPSSNFSAPATDTSNALVDDENVDKAQSNMECFEVVKVETVDISSAILAGKSPFFYKLLVDRAKRENEPSVQIYAHEEAAFMDLLNYTYMNTLPTKTQFALLDVLKVADKFEVASCVTYCCQTLCVLPMTCDFAFKYLKLPSSLPNAEKIKPLVRAAKEFFAKVVMNPKQYEAEIKNLSLTEIKTILSYYHQQILSQDHVFYFILEWAKGSFLDPKDSHERFAFLRTELCRLVRSPHLPCMEYLKEVLLTFRDLDPKTTCEIILETISLHEQQELMKTKPKTSVNSLNGKQNYVRCPVKAIEFVAPRQECIVFWDLKREECLQFDFARWTQDFYLGGHGFYLGAKKARKQPNGHFGLFLYRMKDGNGDIKLNYDFSVREHGTFVSKANFCSTFKEGEGLGWSDLFMTHRDSVMAKKSPFFVNDVLHLRVTIIIIQE